MCQFLSAIVLKNGDVLHSPLLDSHSDLVTLFGLPDTHLHHQHFAKVELAPPADWIGWEDLSKWTFRLDEGTVPGWWSDVAIGAEESVRNIIRRAILPSGERPFLVDGLALIGPGVVVRSMRGGRAVLCGGTLTEMCGGTLTAMCGGTLTAMRGGTLTEMWGGTLTAMCGGTLTEMRGGTLTEMWGGTLTAMWGGTLTAMRGGTLTEVRKEPYWSAPTLLHVDKGVKLNKAARAFIATKPKATRKVAKAKK